MAGLFEKMYASTKRLPRRAYWNDRDRRFELPYLKERGGPVALPESFIRAVSRHIERAFELDYVDAVFFPDMGHSHFLIADERWKTTYEGGAVSEMSRLYERFFDDPALKILYHTAEQLKMRDEEGRAIAEERTAHRRRTRNIIGVNSPESDLELAFNLDHPVNTVQGVDGYRWWGAGFNISANANGCFEYTAKGRTYRYDISLFDVEPDPALGPIGLD